MSYASTAYSGQLFFDKIYANQLYQEGRPLSTPSESGGIDVSSIPGLPADKIVSGDFHVGSFATNIVSTSNLLYNVGSSNYAWKEMHAGLVVSSNLGVGTAAPAEVLHVAGGNARFDSNVIINGTLNVAGAINYTTSSELLVEDLHVTLASSSNATDESASGAGILVQGTDYSNAVDSLSFTWNSASNGDYWLAKGGDLAIAAGDSNFVRVSADASGALSFLNDAEGTPALIADSLIPSGSNSDIGSSNAPWKTIYGATVVTDQIGVGTDAPAAALHVADGNVQFDGNLLVKGKLEMEGEVVFLNSSELLVEGTHITLATSSNATDETADSSGIYVMGSNYATDQSSISFTWNQDASNGDYWLAKGGALGFEGDSNTISLSGDVDGNVMLASGGSVPHIGVSLVPGTDGLNLGSEVLTWERVYATGATLGGAALSGDLDMSSNAILSTGDLGTSSNPLTAAYIDSVEVGSSLVVTSNATTSIGTDLLPLYNTCDLGSDSNS
jgi:hypothetical protein